MPNPWVTIAVPPVASGVVAVVGWVVSPIMSRLVNKYCCVDAPETAEAVPGTEEDVRSKIDLLEIHTIPDLKQTLDKVQEQRMLMAAKGHACNRSRVDVLDKLLGRLSCALYEAEDILDLSDYHRIESELGARRSSNAVGSSTATREEGVTGDDQRDGIPLDSSLFTVDGKSLRERIEHIENIISATKESGVLHQQSGDNELPHSHFDEECQRDIDRLHGNIERKVFGRDVECKKIRDMLRNGPKKGYQVIGIHGVAGSGKTTLAQYVCKYERAAQEKYFDHVIFIRVSKTLNVIDIFHDMLTEIKRDETSDIIDSKSASSNEKRKDPIIEQKELKTKLEGKRFLLVLDDVWVNQEFNQENEKQQEILFYTLNVGKGGSAILVTAQRKDAATALGAVESIRIFQLKDEEYYQMFMHYALKARTFDYEEYEQIGKRIAKKLLRSPTAAVTVAAQLRRNPDIDYWRRTENLDMLNETMGALWWSYQQLGSDIRRCFQYCSIFPKGYELKRKTLVNMWMAQGFVKTSSNATEDMEGVGQCYFDELQACSFLQEDRTGLVIIHDLFHDLARRVAGRDFFRIDLNGFPSNIPLEARHLSIKTYDCDGLETNLAKILELKNLRTIIIVVEQKSNDVEFIEQEAQNNLIKQQVFEGIFKKLRKLRVLIVQEITKFRGIMLSLPASIGEMKHLRILGIKLSAPASIGKMNPLHILGIHVRKADEFAKSGEHATMKLVLPNTFAKLYHIQILDVPGAILDLDHIEDIANLTHFREISGPKEFPNISRLLSLETMPYIFWVRGDKNQGTSCTSWGA